MTIENQIQNRNPPSVLVNRKSILVWIYLLDREREGEQREHGEGKWRRNWGIGLKKEDAYERVPLIPLVIIYNCKIF